MTEISAHYLIELWWGNLLSIAFMFVLHLVQRAFNLTITCTQIQKGRFFKDCKIISVINASERLCECGVNMSLGLYPCLMVPQI